MTGKFVPNPGNIVARELVAFIESNYAALAPQIEQAKGFVHADKDERTSVQIMFPEEFRFYPELLWFDVDCVLGEPRVIIECFAKDTDALIDLGVIQ